MEKEKLRSFYNYIETALVKLASSVSELNLNQASEDFEIQGKRLVATAGVVGVDRGRVMLEMNEAFAQKVFEQMNGVPPDDDLELYFFLAEFANIICGNGITLINNTYQGSDLRLTPPAIFVGDNLEITIPNTLALSKNYQIDAGRIRLKVNFEGI